MENTSKSVAKQEEIMKSRSSAAQNGHFLWDLKITNSSYFSDKARLWMEKAEIYLRA